MRRSGPCWVLISIAIAAAPLFAGPKLLPPRDPAAADVVAVTVEFTRKIAEGDREGAYKLFAGTGDDAKVLEAQLRFVASSDALYKSWAARFKLNAPPLEQSLARMILRQLSEREAREGIILDGDAACTGIRSMIDAGFELRRYGDRWKIIHVSADPIRTPGLLQFYTGAADLMDEFLTKTDAGKFPTVDAAAKEMQGPLRDLTFGNSWYPKGSRTAASRPAADLPERLRTAQQLFALLGAKGSSSQVGAVIDSLPALPTIEEAGDIFYLNSPQTGISFAFTAPAWELHAIHLYAEGIEGFHEYRGSLPNGLTFDMTRGRVEQLLGRPNGIGPGYLVYDRLGFSIRFLYNSPADNRNPALRIAHIALTTPRPDVPSLPPPQGHRPFLTCRAEDHGADAESFPDAQDPSGKSRIRLSSQTLFDESSVEGVFVQPPEQFRSRWTIEVDLAPDAARRLADFSAANVGRNMAIVLNGRVVYRATIRDKLAGHIEMDFGALGTEQECLKVANEIDVILYSLPTTQPAGPK